MKRTVIPGLVLALSAACVTPDIQALSPEALKGGYLDFVEDGATTREAVLLELGDPSGIFEDGRILTYVLRIDEADQVHVLTRRLGTAAAVAWRPGLYSLVLVFRPDGVLARHSVVLGE